MFRALDPFDVQVEHVGSTAVKGLAAKPIIDIDIIYDKKSSFEEIGKHLELLGYTHVGDQGIKGREVFKRQKSFQNHEVLDSIQHHLYVCHFDNVELRKHLAFRDHLRANEDARNKYEYLKFVIAQKANHDRKTYAKLKEELASDFIWAILDSKGNSV